MKRFSLAFLALLVSLPVLAAEPQKQQQFLLYEEVANPAMAPQYEAAVRDLVAALAEKKASPSSFTMTTFMGSDLHYMFMTPISSWAQVDTINKDWMGASELVGKDRWTDIRKRGDAAMLSFDSVIITRRDDLSYYPENPRLPREAEPFAHLEFYYLRPGTEEQAAQICRDYVALFKANKIADGFQIFMADSGHELPLLVAAIPAKSAADYAAVDEKTTASLGDPLRALQARALSITRRVERKDIWLRPDLSYLPK